MNTSEKPIIFEKGESEDHRGSLEYYNDLALDEFKRFYKVRNPKRGTVRAWHGHKVESKLIKVVNGIFIVCLIKVDNWEKPSKNIEILEYEFDSNSGLIYVPPGYANGAMNVTNDSEIMYFSNLSLEESTKDDIRFESNYWDPWKKYSPEIYE